MEKKLNLTQQKHAFTNQKKCTTTQNKHKKTKARFRRLLYDILPGNKGPTVIWHFINLSLTYLLRHLPTYLQPQDPHRAIDKGRIAPSFRSLMVDEEKRRFTIIIIVFTTGMGKIFTVILKVWQQQYSNTLGMVVIDDRSTVATVTIFKE